MSFLKFDGLHVDVPGFAFFFLFALPLFGAEPNSGGLPEGRLLHSHARPDQAVVKHLSLDLLVDFESKKLTGSATLKFERKDDAKELRLDSHGLEIRKVSDQSGVELAFKVGEKNQLLGEGLTVTLGEATTAVQVEYATTDAAEAVQWLTPEQTSGGKQPFLFTQSQAILARTWVPCQDTPAVRMTYDAKIKVPSRLLAVMSATNPQSRNESGVYEFEMKQPIPAYLLALAVGDLEFKSLGDRSGVYAEPDVLPKATWEFADTERMIEAAEKLYGPYRWERYDLVVLPPSFPFGGMENPRLTFATPTILAGDRSLVALVAHELAHSWSGNLVTNATWNDFWLNEGFTVYFEQRIMEAIYGRNYSEMLAKLNLASLREEMEDLSPRDTWLKLDLRDRNPDDGMTGVAYDKGYFFLRRLEEVFGREAWDAFLKSYFDRFSFKSMTTEGFITHLKKELLEKDSEKSASVNLDAWVFGPGVPESCPKVDSDELVKVTEHAEAFLEGTSLSVVDAKDWSTHHWLHFLRSFEKPLPVTRMKQLDGQFGLSKQGNSEILHDWLLLSVRSQYEPAYPALERFLTEQGRRKFLEPLYRALIKTESGRELASKIYRKARPTYHPISQATVDGLLEWNASE